MNDITTLLGSLSSHVAVQFAHECSARAAAAYRWADKSKDSRTLAVESINDAARAIATAIKAIDDANTAAKRAASWAFVAGNTAAHAAARATMFAGGDADDERAWQVARLRELIDAKEDEK